MRNLPSWLFWILPLYAVFSLTAMAGMNLSFLLVACVWLCTYFIFNRLEVHSSRSLEFKSELKLYRFWAGALFVTCVASLTAAKFWPYSYAGHAP